MTHVSSIHLTKPEAPTPAPLPIAIFRTALRISVILALAWGAHLLIDKAMHLTDSLPETDQGRMRTMIVVTALLVYALLIALPFVPGIEIGLTLLVLRGAEVAPFVYLSTLAGLLLAYGIGRYLPLQLLHRMFLDLRLTGACRLLDRVAPLTPTERLALLRARMPRRLGTALIRFRYLTLAILLNLPGNSVIGGGGGLCLLAGLTRLFAPWATILTLAICVAPVPLAVWLFGYQMP